MNLGIILGPSWAHPGSTLAAPGAFLGPLWPFRAPFSGHLRPSWGLLERYWCLIYSGHDFVNFHTILFILDTFHYMLLHLSKRDLIIPRLFDFVNQMTCLFHFFMRFGHHLGPCTIYLGSQKSTLELSWRWDYFTLVCIALSHTWGKLSYWGWWHVLLWCPVSLVGVVMCSLGVARALLSLLVSVTI